MSTNALELRTLLVAAASQSDEKTLAQALAIALKLDGPNADIEAASVTARLARKIELDISLMPDAESRQHATENFSQYFSLGNLGHFAQVLKSAKGNILKPENLKQLSGVHASLLGIRELSIDKEVLDEKAAVLLEIANELATKDELPENLRKYFYEQLKTVASVLSDYSKFGPAYAEAKLLQLISALAFNGGQIKSQSPGLFTKMRDAAFDGMRGLQQADKTIDAAEGIANSDSIQKALEVFKSAL